MPSSLHSPPKEPWNSSIWRDRPTFLYSRRPLARYVGRPAAEFLKIEPAAGIVLLVCAVAAMLWANSPWAAWYESLWGMDITLHFGDFELHHSLRDWINDGLMAVFFFVVGMEIKSEIVSGHLRSARNAVAPIAGAVGGMAVPALIYAAFNAGGEGVGGWGIPMATDIAFAVGVLALFGSRIPSPARIFLLTLAIVDDLGAIAVIAVFYTDHLSMTWLAAAGALIVLAILLRLLNVWSGPVYLVIGVLLWVAMLESGIHATIAGVVMGLIISAKPLLDPEVAHAEVQEMKGDHIMLLGVITGCNYFSFLNQVESTTADRIDWHTFAGRVEDPYPPDVWIEGNNGHQAMRVNYKGTRSEFEYADFTNDQSEIDTMALASAVIAHIERSIAEDPNPRSGGRSYGASLRRRRA